MVLMIVFVLLVVMGVFSSTSGSSSSTPGSSSSTPGSSSSTPGSSSSTPGSSSSIPTSLRGDTSSCLVNSCNDPLTISEIEANVVAAYERMIEIQTVSLHSLHPLNNVELAFLEKFKRRNPQLQTITHKILREYFTTCRLEYRYVIIIEPLSSPSNDPRDLDQEIITMKARVLESVNMWFQPFITLGLFPDHTAVDCICVEVIVKRSQPGISSFEGMYVTDQGDLRSDSVAEDALWFKTGGTFHQFDEYGAYLETKCPTGSFPACQDSHYMHEITLHYGQQYKTQNTIGTVYTKSFADKQTAHGTSYKRFNKSMILRRTNLSLFNHEFGHAFFGLPDSLVDGGATWNGVIHEQSDLRRNQGSCYGLSQGCDQVFPFDYHCAAYTLMQTLDHMSKNKGWIYGYMRG
jgi:hypothetical protein